MTFINEKEQALLEANAKARSGEKKKGNYLNEPDHRVEVPGFPEVEIGIFIADAKSRNSGAVYFDVRRIGEKGKRYKLLRLDADFLGAILAHGVIAERLSLDETITASEREQFAILAADIAQAVLKHALPEKSAEQRVNGEQVSPFAKAA